MTRDALIAALIAGVWAVAIVMLNWGSWKIDLSAIYYAARSFGEGLPALVYDAGPRPFLTDPPVEWINWAQGEGFSAPQFTPYLYPPLWAAALAPAATSVGAQVFFDVSLVLNAAATVWMVWLAWRLMRPIQIGPVGWALLSFALMIATAPGYMAFWFGQPQVIVSAFILASFVALAEKRDILAGGFLALAAMAKISPVLLALIFIMEKRWTALASFAVFMAVLFLASIGTAGWALHPELVAKLAAIEAQILISPLNVSLEQAFYYARYMLTGEGDLTVRPHMVPETAWIAWLTRGFLIAATAALWWGTRNLALRLRLWTRLMGLVLITLLANPLGWVHYLILPLILLPGLIEVLPRRIAILGIALIALPLSLPVFIYFGDTRGIGLLPVLLNTGATLVMLGFVVLAARREANP
ncbi:glycosyltransferase family 87 protein [Maritimibacter alexandrii]|uniref:glycosyltransferase family 87 protein n=1 Tax=Maritimibacter alexandrii TaxID=2570355 RepID=UPI0011090BC3|nr:glycosyltransferase family 87 protein [Maritimibacter alexandrii]